MKRFIKRVDTIFLNSAGLDGKVDSCDSNRQVGKSSLGRCEILSIHLGILLAEVNRTK